MTNTTTASERSGDRIAPTEACPTCGHKGRKVKRVTLESLLRPERRADVAEGPYHVCTTPECETVYFGPDGGATFSKSDLIVRFGLKEASPPRPVCYCFDHSIEGIHDEIRRTGESTVVESIKTDMQGPGCRCEYTNPLGACCLSSVQTAVAEGFRMSGQAGTAVAATHTEHEGCCATPTDSDSGTTGRRRSGALVAGGLMAAILSSACCWLPLLLVAFGLSAVGVAGFFDVYRPYFVVGAVGLLGTGFYTVYLRKEKCAPGAACATPNRKRQTVNQVMLWGATVLVGAFVFFPNYVGHLLGAPSAPTRAATDAPLVEARYEIEGMTCEGCAATLHKALAKLPEVAAVAIEYPKKIASIRYYADKPVPRDGVIAAVKDAGYRATFAAETRVVTGDCCAP